MTPLCAGGPLLYDGVQLVQNSASLNGTQRVLLDQVITEEECSALKHLAHVRTPQSFMSFWIFLLYQLFSCLSGCHRSRRRLQRQDVSTHSKRKVRRSHCSQNLAGTLLKKEQHDSIDSLRDFSLRCAPAVRLWGQSAHEQRTLVLWYQRAGEANYWVVLPAQLHPPFLLHPPGVSDSHHRSGPNTNTICFPSCEHGKAALTVPGSRCRASLLSEQAGSHLRCFHRPARPPKWPESSHPRRQLSARPRGQRVLEGAPGVHVQRLQVSFFIAVWPWLSRLLNRSFFFECKTMIC